MQSPRGVMKLDQNRYRPAQNTRGRGELCLKKRRVEALAKLKTSIITETGGEPLLHSDLFAIINHIRAQSFLTALIANGFLLPREKVEQLNSAGL